MTRTEVNELIKIIQVHRPFFISRLGDDVYKSLIVEWERIMENYEFEDVKNNLETFLKNENNYGKDPDAYILIKGLYTKEEKKEQIKGSVGCMFCKRLLPMNQIKEHENRCRSINYLKRLYKKYFKKELEDVANLYSISNDVFDKAYIRVLEKVLPMVEDTLEKRGITNVIETYYGREPIYSINEF